MRSRQMEQVIRKAQVLPYNSAGKSMLTNIHVASKNGSYTDLALNVEDPHLPK
jgi:hypothetical protein